MDLYECFYRGQTGICEVIGRRIKTEITENSAIIRWKVDVQNPVDSISVMPMMDKTLANVSRYLTEEEKHRDVPK